MKVDYKVYATLLDSFMDYQDSDAIYDKYWGWSENPPHTPEEFHQLQFQGLIDKINRVPFDSEAADKGTAFNEVVDCMIEHRKSEKVEINKILWNEEHLDRIINGNTPFPITKQHYTSTDIGINAKYNNREFVFNINLLREFANYYKGALTQQYVEAVIHTSKGNVLIYGYIDELMPTSVHDIKTTSQYYVGKFKNHSQHLVYPYCLIQSGNDIKTFEYNVATIGVNNYQTYTETYVFNPERDIPILTHRIEDLIQFVEDNRHLITDKKIFGGEKT